MKNAVKVKTYKFTAYYYGGAYIDLYDNRDGKCYDCINVWDYENREATIAHNVDGVRDAILALQDDDARLHPEMYR